MVAAPEPSPGPQPPCPWVLESRTSASLLWSRMSQVGGCRRWGSPGPQEAAQAVEDQDIGVAGGPGGLRGPWWDKLKERVQEFASEYKSSELWVQQISEILI